MVRSICLLDSKGEKVETIYGRYTKLPRLLRLGVVVDITQQCTAVVVTLRGTVEAGCQQRRQRCQGATVAFCLYPQALSFFRG